MATQYGTYRIEVEKPAYDKNYVVWRNGVFWFSHPSKEHVHNVLGQVDARKIADDQVDEVTGLYTATRPFVANVAR